MNEKPDNNNEFTNVEQHYTRNWQDREIVPPSREARNGGQKRKSGGRNVFDFFLGLTIGILPAGIAFGYLVTSNMNEKVINTGLQIAGYLFIIVLIAAIVSFIVRKIFLGIGILCGFCLIPLLLFGSCVFFLSNLNFGP